jgi:anthranilate synthase component 1
MQMAINIRGVHMRDGIAKIQVGAGVVKDSVPAHEWKELGNKARTLNTIFSAGK